jgi:hypothetical protein
MAGTARLAATMTGVLDSHVVQQGGSNCLEKAMPQSMTHSDMTHVCVPIHHTKKAQQGLDQIRGNV